MIKINKYAVCSIMLVVTLALFTGCASTRLTVKSKELALTKVDKAILIIPPLSPNLSDEKACERLGLAFTSEIPKLINGQIIYARNIEALQKTISWSNLMKNGAINTDEVVTMAKTVGCSTALTCRIIEYKKYPPFKMVVSLLWIDVETESIIARAYNNVDIADYETEHKFATFAGHGPVKRVYEELTYSTDTKHSASLSPNKFCDYVSAHSTQMLFGDLFEVPWYKFWNIL